MYSALFCILIGILSVFPETDSSSITWIEPLPTDTIPSGVNPKEHINSTQLRERKINSSLSWHFTLSELNFVSLTLSFNNNIIGAVKVSGDVVVSDGYRDKYGLQWIRPERITLIIFDVTTTEVNGTFECAVVAEEQVGTVTFKSKIQVEVVDPASNIVTSSNQPVSLSDELTLNCSADGRPKPTITWTRLSDNTVVTMPFNISSRQYGGCYRCTAYNGVGNPLRKDVCINVLFPPNITIESKFLVGREQTASLTCEVEGNPPPTIHWTPCDRPSIGCDKQYLNISKVQTSRANYTCTANNSEGSDSETTLLIIGGKNIFVSISTSGKCDEEVSVWKILQNELVKVFANTQSYIGAELIADIRCGSLIFNVVLKFNTQVAEDVIISTIRNAIVDGMLGELKVNASSVIGIKAIPLPTTMPPPIKTTPKPESYTETEGYMHPKHVTGDNTWIIVGAVLGAVALVIIVAVIIWFVRKKKFPNETKVSDTNDAGQGRRGGAQGQNGGDESAYASTYSNASVLPPSKKPTSTGKEDAGQAIALPVYAQVDKSKKKPRSEKEAQRQPGELLYVQADHSNEGSLPTKASGNPSRPPPYQDTVYADLV